MCWPCWPCWPCWLAALALLALFYPPSIRVDDDKYLAFVERLEADGQAEQLARAVGPTGVVEAFGSDTFHDMAFMTDERVPPSMASIVVDGHRAGSLLRIDRSDQAEVLDGTLMALPYGLVPSNPRVLLLDEVGGGNIWLARRHGAATVDVVQPNRVLADLLAGPLEDEGGMVFDLPGVALHPVESRAFLEGTRDSFDLIQLAGMESWSAAAGGLEGLNQDHLMTVEGVATALRRLSPDGILHVSRGIQLPPRDNAKIAATVIAALEQSGITRSARSARPGAHIAMVRDFLGVCTMVRPRPWREGEIRRLRDRAAERNLTPVYFQGITAGELNRPDELPGPPGEDGDYLYHVMRSLLSRRPRTKPPGSSTSGPSKSGRPPTTAPSSAISGNSAPCPISGGPMERGGCCGRNWLFSSSCPPPSSLRARDWY